MFKNKISSGRTKQKLKFIALILPIFLSGCISFSSQSTKPAEVTGGLFRSDTLGQSWVKVNTLYTLGQQNLTFDAASVTVMAFDPLDEKAIYLGTQHDGLFYSYEYGNGWFRTLTGKGTVNDIAVDPQRSCTIYVAVHNAIYKSEDCSRSWEKIYFETTTGSYMTSLEVSNRDDRIVYAANSKGSLLRSKDYGNTWDAIYRFEDNVKNIFVLEDETQRIVYAVTQKKGIYKSTDDGDTWEDLLELQVDRAEVDEDEEFEKLLEKEEEKKLDKEGVPLTKEEKIEMEKTLKYLPLNKVSGAKTVVASSLDRSVEDSVIYTSRGSIFRLIQGKYGPMWKQIKLLTPPASKEVIYAVLVNPKNTDEIFYATSAALYHSIDNGASWSISDLPTNHSARSLAFSLDNRFLYLGAYSTAKK